MTRMLLPIKVTDAQVQAALRQLELDDTPANRQRAVDHLARQTLAPKPFTRRAVLQIEGHNGKFRHR